MRIVLIFAALAYAGPGPSTTDLNEKIDTQAAAVVGLSARIGQLEQKLVVDERLIVELATRVAALESVVKPAPQRHFVEVVAADPLTTRLLRQREADFNTCLTEVPPGPISGIVLFGRDLASPVVLTQADGSMLGARETACFNYVLGQVAFGAPKDEARFTFKAF